jgi:hypothetical protein
MARLAELRVVAIVLVVANAAVADPAAPQSASAATGGVSPDATAQIVSRLVAEAIPREYERTKDWGRTKRITTGIRSSGNFFDFDIHRRKTEVNHGIWKHYRATLVEPEKNLLVRMDNLRSLEAGRIALTLFVTTRLHGWGRAKVYDRGIHFVSLEAEADAKVRLWLDVEIALETAPASFLSGIAVRPQVTSARMTLDEFRLTRISDLSGPLVHELGDGLRHLIEDELNGPRLAAKLNRSIEKRRDRLVFTPDTLLGAARGAQ